MGTRIMWRFIRRLFKITVVVFIIGMIVIAADMASLHIFNMDHIWPFNLFFS